MTNDLHHIRTLPRVAFLQSFDRLESQLRSCFGMPRSWGTCQAGENLLAAPLRLTRTVPLLEATLPRLSLPSLPLISVCPEPNSYIFYFKVFVESSPVPPRASSFHRITHRHHYIEIATTASAPIRGCECFVLWLSSHNSLRSSAPRSSLPHSFYAGCGCSTLGDSNFTPRTRYKLTASIGFGYRIMFLTDLGTSSSLSSVDRHLLCPPRPGRR